MALAKESGITELRYFENSLQKDLAAVEAALTYDIVLIVPFLTRLPTVAPQLRLNLYIYTAIVVYSGLLAIYYLFIHKTTRLWG